MIERWEHKPLREICVFQRGLTYAKSDEVDSPGHAVLRANNIDLTSHELDFNELKFISASVAVPESKIVRHGSLLVCTASGSKTHLGKVAYIDSDYGYAFGGFMGQLTPSKSVDGRYLFYVLISPGYKDFIEALSDGVNINNLKFDDLGSFLVPVPPLPEQRRIVAILDEAFEAIATAKANTEKNLQNARDAYDGYLEAAFAQLEGTAPIEKLGKLCEFEGGSQPPKSEFVYAPKIGYVRFLQIRDFGTDRHETYIPEAKKNRFCTESDILIGRYGASVGKILTGKAGAYNVALIKTVPNLSMLDPEFFHLYLTSGAFQSRLKKVAARSAQNGFSKEDIFDFPVPLPPLSQQQAIVEQIDPVHEESQRLAAIYERKVTALNELKKSLLHQAYTGQLTAKSTDQQLEAVA